ncbi:hypothetical protein LCGC14_1256670 [marine sediment metagenome]|uniref:Uncharacterized protein n=1 Tax=marine sediment metagenome TaxID=412755 RepID=A0A0F9NII1_9ZZZZ
MKDKQKVFVTGDCTEEQIKELEKEHDVTRSPNLKVK